MKKVTKLGFSMLLVFFLVNVSSAATIRGKVSDGNTKKGLEGVNIVVEGTKEGAATGREGNYELSGLSQNTYKVTASRMGYKSETKKIKVEEGMITSLNFVLKEEALQMEEIVVMTAREGVTITPRKTIIDIAEITKVRNTETVEDVLATMPGIDVPKSGLVSDPRQVMTMRGFDDIRYVVAVDGCAWGATFARNDCPIDWSAMTVNDVDRIEVIRGGSSALYDGAEAGIVNIISKKTRAGKLMPKITAGVKAGDFDTYGGNIGISGGIGELGYFFSGEKSSSDGFLRNESFDGYNLNSKIVMGIPLLRGKFSFGYKKKLSITGFPIINDPSRADYNDNYPALLEDVDNFRYSVAMSYPGGKSYFHKTMEYLTASYDQSIGRGSLLINFFGNRGRDTTASYVYKSGKLTQTWATENEYTLSGGLRYSLNWKENHHFTAGYDYRNLGIFPNEENKELGIAYKVDRPNWYSTTGVYMENVWNFANGMNVTTGLRWGYLDEWTPESYRDPLTGDTLGRVHIYYKAWLPKFTFGYNFSDKTTAFVSVNRDWHYPNCCDRTTWSTGSFNKGSFGAETAMLYDAGFYRRLAEDVDTRVTFYYSNIDNFISADKNTYPVVKYAYNIEKVWSKGVEIELSKSIKSDIGGYVNYSHRIMDWKDSTVTVEPYWLTISPKHKANMGIDYEVVHNTIVSLEGTAAVNRFSKYGMWMQDYYVMNFGIKHKLLDEKANVTFRIENLLDEQYQEVHGFQMPGRHFGMQLNYVL